MIEYKVFKEGVEVYTSDYGIKSLAYGTAVQGFGFSDEDAQGIAYLTFDIYLKGDIKAPVEFLIETLCRRWDELKERTRSEILEVVYASI